MPSIIIECEVDQRSEIGKLMTAAIAKAGPRLQEGYAQPVEPVDHAGYRFEYNPDRKNWFIRLEEVLEVSLTSLRDQGVIWFHTEIEETFNSDRPPYRGRYAGWSFYAGCGATVQHAATPGSRVLRVWGHTPEKCVRYYTALLRRDFDPQDWWEPKLSWLELTLRFLHLIRR